MRVGFTAPPLTEEQREAKRLAKLKPSHEVCRAGHPRTDENTLWHEGALFCAACVEDGTTTLTTVRWVYFIADGAGHVKIGHAFDVAARLRSIQTGNALPLSVLAVLNGGCDTERALHERFAEHRVRGEWFRLAPEVIEFIASIPRPARPKKPEPKLKPKLVPPRAAKPKNVPEYVRIQRDLIAQQGVS